MATTQATTETSGAVPPGQSGSAQTGGVDREFTARARSRPQQIIRRFLHEKVAMPGLVFFLLLLVFGFTAPLLEGKTYAEQTAAPQSVAPGTAGYLLGSDAIGRALLA